MSSLSRSLAYRTATALLVASAVFSSANSAPLALQDVPLYLLSRADPNVLINMSVETPMGGAAYTDQAGVPTSACAGRTTVGTNSVGACYSAAYAYIGYFNPNKCYTYVGAQFNPTATAAVNHACTGAWSGNFLNWASMTAIDMFIMTMTGGNRIVDTIGGTAETVVRRARKTDNDSWFPIKYLNATTNVAPSTVTPYTDTTLYIYNTAFGFNVATTFAGAVTPATVGGGFKASFTTAARVCTATPVGLDDANCVPYGAYSKPEGSIQRNARTKRFGAISYSTDGANNRHGGILRSNMKYVGPKMPDGTTDNPLAEFRLDGTLVNNPDGAASP